MSLELFLLQALPCVSSPLTQTPAGFSFSFWTIPPWVSITFAGMICSCFSDFRVHGAVFHWRVRWCSRNAHTSCKHNLKHNLYNLLPPLSCADWKHLGFKSCFLLALRCSNILWEPCSAAMWLMEQAGLFWGVTWRQRLFRSCSVPRLMCFPHSPNSHLPWIYCSAPSLLHYCLQSFLLILCVGDDFLCWAQLWGIGSNLLREWFGLPKIWKIV